MNSNFGGPGWGRTNDQPIMRPAPDRLRECQGVSDVLTSERGTLADGPNVTHRFHKLLKRAELRPIRFHDLRHACASLLLVQGVHPRVVMETLGHSQISLTMNTYSHVIPALRREAADKMQAVLENAQ